MEKLENELDRGAQWSTDACSGVRRAGPSRCGAQCKTWARGPMQDLGTVPL